MFILRKLASFATCCFLASGLSACGSSNGGSTLTGITIAPISPTIAVGATQLFTAAGHFSNHPDQDLTHQASRSSSVTSVATIAGAGVQPSLATGVALGHDANNGELCAGVE